ncbi:MAG: hypothetical protein SVE93_02305 [Candidatus Thermoplasmatota archaeon]|nr:hypothetical protein [Candidatus Thermoplasmatota archaeon]
MTVLLATLGFTHQAVMPSLRWAKNLKKVVLFHSKNAKSKEAKEKIREGCKALGVQFEPYEVKDEYALTSIIKEMNEELSRISKEYRNEEIIFNITGGTKMLASAALIICIMKGIKAIYIRETDGEILEVPLLRMKYSDVLTSAEKKTLRGIADICEENGSDEIRLSLIYEKHMRSDSVISTYIKKLEKLGLVETFVKEDNRREKWLKFKDSAKLCLLGDE